MRDHLVTRRQLVFVGVLFVINCVVALLQAFALAHP